MTYSNFNLNTSPLVISFYTNDGDYPKYAELLSEDCERLGIDYYIEGKSSTKSYKKNCNIKPFFIKKTVKYFKKPVLWFDVDGTINSFPKELIEISKNYDIAMNINPKFSDRYRVNSIWFNYTPETLRLINAWCEYCTNNIIDDLAFNKAIKDLQSSLRVLILPEYINVVLKASKSPVPQDSYFVHRLSNSEIKRKEKYKFNKK